MTPPLEGEVVHALGPPWLARRPDVLGAWVVHFVDLPDGGRIEGMDRASAMRLAADLGTAAYAAGAVLLPDGLVVVDLPRLVWRRG